MLPAKEDGHFLCERHNIPIGESPIGTGGSPVLPIFQTGSNGAGRNGVQLDTPTTRRARGAERGSLDPQRVGRFAGAAGRETRAPVRAGGSSTHSKRFAPLRACTEKLAGCSRRRKEADFYARNSRPFRLLTSAATISVQTLRCVSFALLALLFVAPLAQAQTNRPSGTVVSWGLLVIPYVEPGTRFTAVAA